MSTSRGRLRFRSLLFVTEVALALVLLVGSGLLIRSVIVLLRVDPGFVPERRAMVQLFLWDLYPKPELRAGALRDMLDHMMVVPGVESVGAVSALPFAAVKSPLTSAEPLNRIALVVLPEGVWMLTVKAA